MSGAYTEITKIHTDKDSYYSGETVWVSVFIKNIHTATTHIYCAAEQDGEQFVDLDAWVSAGLTYSFGGYFTMPGKAVTITAYSYYDGVHDDTRTKDVPLAELEPEFSQFTIDFDRTVKV